PLAFRLSRLSAAELVFPEGFLSQHADTPDAAYYQVNSDWGGGWRSPSLGARSFPFDPAQFARTPLYDWKFDDAELPSGVAVRRVTLKARCRGCASCGGPSLAGPCGSGRRLGRLGL